MMRLYSLLPVFLQHLLITIKNNHSYYQKYRALPWLHSLGSIYRKLQPTDWINDAQVLERINALLATAKQHVPYYQAHAADYAPLRSLTELQNLPVLTKATLRANSSLFISDLSTSRNSYSFKTSGSTGSPLQGVVSLDDLHRRFMTVLSSLKINGIDYSKRVGRFLGAEVADASTVYRVDFINRHYLFSIYSLSEQSIVKYYDAITSNSLEILEGYPSTLYALVQHLKAKNLQINCVQHVITTAEKLLDYQKEAIMQYFGCSVMDYYGSSEGSAYLFTHEGVYHNANTVGYVEIVDEQYLPVAPGTMGRMLVTSFTSSFMPLIRYDIGDYSMQLPSVTSSPFALQFSALFGRSESVFITEEGVHFTRFSLCLKYLPSILLESQLQLVQRSKQVKVVCVLPDGISLSTLDFSPFEQKFQSMLGSGYQFAYEAVLQFEKSARGKLSAVQIKS